MNKYEIEATSINILVVDDTSFNLRLLSESLILEGYQVKCVMNGQMALSIVEKTPPDLILLDIMMPQIDGYEVCKRLKANRTTCDIPVIFLSALDEPLDKVKAFELGGVDYITKPFELVEVFARIQNHLKLQQALLKIQQLNEDLETRVKKRTFALEQEIKKHEKTQKQLRHQAFHDALTGLANRTLFLELLQQEINCIKRDSSYLFAVLFLDCDRFKNVNDSLGHIVGDGILIEISHRLEACLHKSDRVARLGGDEFGIILDNINKLEEAFEIAERINQKFKKAFIVNDKEIYLSFSIGIVEGSKEYNEPEVILRNADLAMYKAKSLGKSCYQIFNTDMHQEVQEVMDLENRLHTALKNEEFSLLYQPIVSLKTRKIASLEVLLRWNNPETGFIPPDKFISLAEETGLIIPIGMWVFKTACTAYKNWQEQYAKELPFTLSINISVKQFSQSNLLEQIKTILDETQIDSHKLKLEITESVIIENYELANQILKQLKDWNIQLSIDDFGTGYSSLSYLYRFPVNSLKIDRSFIKEIDSKDDKNVGIVKSIISIAHHLNMDVVAEGIETKQQYQKLKNLGCDYGQGYLFSKPLSKNSINQFLRISDTE